MGNDGHLQCHCIRFNCCACLYCEFRLSRFLSPDSPLDPLLSIPLNLDNGLLRAFQFYALNKKLNMRFHGLVKIVVNDTRYRRRVPLYKESRRYQAYEKILGNNDLVCGLTHFRLFARRSGSRPPSSQAVGELCNDGGFSLMVCDYVRSEKACVREKLPHKFRLNKVFLIITTAVSGFGSFLSFGGAACSRW